MYVKKWYKSTTLWINFLLGASSITAVVAEFLQSGDFSVPALIGLAFAVANVVNRLRPVSKAILV